MPNARSGRDADVATARSRDQEWKRSRGAIACAECRRLKLKCDKTVPCTSCKRRGCASICPNGSLVTGQGTRFVLADTDRLHSKIADMSDRIRQLEDALNIAHASATHGQQPHPLLNRDLLDVKSMIDLHSAASRGEAGQPTEEADEGEALDIFGTLAVREGGGSTFYGRSAGQESILLGEQDVNPGTGPTPSGSGPVSPHVATGFPRAVTELAGAFPDASTQHLGLFTIESYLPPWERASTLCALYLQQAPWFFGSVRARQLHEELLPMFYGEADARSPGLASTATATPHDLALLFVILCYGSLVDDALPPAPDNIEAERYYLLTRAALALDPVTDHAPTVSTVQALSLMAIYQGLVANENSIESTWTLFGMASKLAQSVGLHRDCARWNLPPSEVQKRRALFWEIFITDCWQGLATGRLATFSLPFVDCELPQDTEQILDVDGTPQDSFPYWKARFGKQCVSEVVQVILTARPPKYSRIVDLDRIIRGMEYPSYANNPPPPGATFDVLMQHFMPQNYRHLTLLYVHRAFFAQGLCDHPLDPLRSTYAPSIMSGYRSACELLGNLRKAFEAFPVQITRYWVLWTHSFSSAVMLALIPVRAPLTKMAHTALLELQQAKDLYEKAAPYGGRAVKMAPIVRRHYEKASAAFHTARSQAAQRLAPEIFPSPARDEFSVFSGVTSTVKAPARAPSARSASSVYHSSPSGASPGGSSSGEFGDRPDTSTSSSGSQPDQSQSQWGDAHVRAALNDQLMTFDSALDAQLNDAPRSAGLHGELNAGVVGGMIYAPGPHSYVPPPMHHQADTARPPGPPPPPTHYAGMPPPPPPPPQIAYSMSLPPGAAYPAPPHASAAYEAHQTAQWSSAPTTPRGEHGGGLWSPTEAQQAQQAQHQHIQFQQQQHQQHSMYPHARPREGVSARAHDRVLRQSGDLSLTEAWGAFMKQMDMQR